MNSRDPLMRKNIIKAGFRYLIWAVLFFVFTKLTNNSKIIDDALDPYVAVVVLLAGIFVIGFAAMFGAYTALAVFRASLIEETIGAVSIIGTLWAMLLLRGATAEFGVSQIDRVEYLIAAIILSLVILVLLPWFVTRFASEDDATRSSG